MSLLLTDRISTNLCKNLKLHDKTKGPGHTCCDVHWNANLEVAVIEHHEDNNIVPMAILRARKDIEKDTEILVIVVPVWLLLHNFVVIVVPVWLVHAQH